MNAELKLSSEVDSMLGRIIDNGSVFYRSEQRGTPDLTIEEKKTFLNDLYTDKPSLFLSRYYKYMKAEDCQCFDLNDYANAHFAKLISEQCSSSKAKILMRNRRYSELVRLKRETDYFSHKRMREREPELFERMIGQFLPETEREHLRPSVQDVGLSDILLRAIDSKPSVNCRKAETNIFDSLESSQFQNDKLWGSNFLKHVGSRFQDSIDYDEEPEETDPTEPPSDTTPTSDDILCDPSSSDEDVNEVQLENDFLDHMEQRFLKGQDTEFFDYETLDNSVFIKEHEKMQNQDFEDAYFDSD